MKSLITLSLLFAISSAAAQQDSIVAKQDTSAARLLKEVVITANRLPVEVLPDKVVLHMDAQPSAIGETALDVLRRAPGVAIDAAENLQMNGKTGVNVWIDGKPTGLTSADLAGLLKGVEAGNIRKIELIANPSARYDAAGNAGIINIQLKKSISNGANGNISAAHIHSTHARQNATANFNWRKNKAALFMNASGRRGLQHTIANNERTAGDRKFFQRSIEKDFFNASSIRLGSDLFLNKKSTIGVLWMYNRNYTRMDNGSTSFLLQTGKKDTVIRTRSIVPFPSHRNALNLNYAYTGAKTQ
ncbi:MAG TPA: hypothetical protein VM843_01050, partial [Flavisolibacter sp.]|nr:hypothetical protein [Flavisolibacter sp.]